MEEGRNATIMCPFCGQAVNGIIKEDETGSSAVIDKKDHTCKGIELCLKGAIDVPSRIRARVLAFKGIELCLKGAI